MSTIGKALGAVLVEALETLADYLRTRRETRVTHKPPPVMPWEKGHNWQRHLGIPVLCVWCKQELTASNEFAPCPGP